MSDFWQFTTHYYRLILIIGNVYSRGNISSVPLSQQCQLIKRRRAIKYKKGKETL